MATLQEHHGSEAKPFRDFVDKWDDTFRTVHLAQLLFFFLAQAGVFELLHNVRYIKIKSTLTD
jgi:hypothetical protein